MCDHHSAELNLVEHEPEIRYLVISQNSPGAGWTVSFIPIYGYMVSGVRIQFPGASVLIRLRRKTFWKPEWSSPPQADGVFKRS